MTESEVYLLLKNNATLKTLVNERVYPLIAPQNVVKPYQIYQGDYRMQLDCFSLTYSNVKAISKAVENALSGFMDSNSINIIDDYEDQTALFKQIIDFKLKD